MIFHRHTVAIRKIGIALLNIGHGDGDDDLHAIELLKGAIVALEDKETCPIITTKPKTKKRWWWMLCDHKGSRSLCDVPGGRMFLCTNCGREWFESDGD